MTIQQFFSYIMARTQYIQRNDPDVDPRSTRPNASCIAEKQQISILLSLAWPDRD